MPAFRFGEESGVGGWGGPGNQIGDSATACKCHWGEKARNTAWYYPSCFSEAEQSLPKRVFHGTKRTENMISGQLKLLSKDSTSELCRRLAEAFNKKGKMEEHEHIIKT